MIVAAVASQVVVVAVDTVTEGEVEDTTVSIAVADMAEEDFSNVKTIMGTFKKAEEDTIREGETLTDRTVTEVTMISGWKDGVVVVVVAGEQDTEEIGAGLEIVNLETISTTTIFTTKTISAPKADNRVEINPRLRRLSTNRTARVGYRTTTRGKTLDRSCRTVADKAAAEETRGGLTGETATMIVGRLTGWRISFCISTCEL